MPYDLYNLSTGICLTFSTQFFAKALELGELFGWQPRRTHPPARIDFCELGADWHGEYLTNDGQKVLATDAKWLASALENSLLVISDDNPHLDLDPRLWTNDDLPEWLSPEEKQRIEDELQEGLLDIMRVHPVDFFAGNEKRYLVKLIRFCRLGSFEIN